ncbi:hypothetical protein BG006_009430, partial [Podila minutissima]
LIIIAPAPRLGTTENTSSGWDQGSHAAQGSMEGQDVISISDDEDENVSVQGPHEHEPTSSTTSAGPSHDMTGPEE